MADEQKRREIVYDAANELAVLRACVASRQVRDSIVRKLGADVFLAKGNAPIFAAFKRLSNEGLDYDEETVRRFLVEAGGDVEGSLLREIERSAEVPENLEWRVATLCWDSTRASILGESLPELVEELERPDADAASVSGKARRIARALERGSGRSHVRRPDELSRGYSAEVAVRRATRRVYPFGFGPMEEKFTEGTKPGRTSVIAGLSGSGKSTLMAEFLLRQARAGRRVLYCAWEMSPESILDVMASSVTGIELTRIVRGAYDDEEEGRINAAVRAITRRVRFQDFPFSRRREIKSGGRFTRKETNDDRLDVLEAELAEHGCDVVVYDLWERALCDLSYEGVTQALYRQQAIHQEYAIHGVIVQQLRGKDVERRADKRPTREAIKGVGAFVDVADLIFGVHREGQFKNVPDDTIELICLKQRKGAANWAFRFDWLPEVCRIRGGEEVSYDPGLDSADLGDIGRIKSKRRRGSPGRPE